MFDLGWTELLVIGIVALIVVGPKDLPILFRQAGRFMGRARAMAREFTSAMNDAADQAGVSDIQNTMRAAADPRSFGADAIRDAIKDPLSEDRAEDARKIAEATAAKATERKAAEAAAEAEAAAPKPAKKDDA